MRTFHLLLLAAISCGTSPDAPEVQTFTFGPLTVAPGQELTTHCASTTLHNDAPIYVRAVDLSTVPGVHHSNWFWVPEHIFAGPDGIWPCAERGFSEAVAGGQHGGVLFAQSTQATRELQDLADGAVIEIPARARIVGGLHLMNASDEPAHVELALTIHPVARDSVETIVAGLAFENHAIELPPQTRSRFTVECDLGAHHRAVLGRPIDFKFYYVLAHYHELGIALTFEAIRDADGGIETIWSTASQIGDTLGAKLDPPYDMTGRSKVRLSCTYDNPRAEAVGWGGGDQEMCIVFAFTGSEYTWSGGVLAGGDRGQPVQRGDLVEFTAPKCVLLTADASH